MAGELRLDELEWRKLRLGELEWRKLRLGKLEWRKLRLDKLEWRKLGVCKPPRSVSGPVPRGFGAEAFLKKPDFRAVQVCA